MAQAEYTRDQLAIPLLITHGQICVSKQPKMPVSYVYGGLYTTAEFARCCFSF